MSIISFNEFQAKYRFDCQLSQGSFGRVCRIQEIATKKFFALKKVSVKKNQEQEDIQNEIRLLNYFRNPFIVQIKETYNIQIKQGFAKPIYEVGIILQLAKCSLQQMIRMKKYLGSSQFIISQVAGLVKILLILQQQNIAHRDIKPANILIFENPDNSYQWKLADFGLALDLKLKGEQQNFAGSFEYASPKLKRKFKYSSLKIKTNPFKDDVYSLGVTLLEALTGLRIYNGTAQDKLRSLCEQKGLVNLIDIMLEEDEDKRPCFKQLMMLLQRDFPTYLHCQQAENIKEINNFHRKMSNFQYKNQQHDRDKTVIKKPQRQIKKSLIQTGKPIRCLANYDDIIFCGCEKGDLLLIKNGNIVNCGPIHHKNVSQLFVDQKGTIWSTGGDSFAKKWNRGEIQKSLISQIKQIAICQSNFLKKNTQRKQLLLQLKQSHYETINFPFFHSCGTSTFFAKDEQNFGVGYNNGYVYLRWEGNQFHHKLFSKPVTAIIYSKSRSKAWLCSLDGQIKKIDLKQLRVQNRFYYKKGASFLGMHLQQQNGEEFLTALSLDGCQFSLNLNLQCVLESTVGKNRIFSYCEIDQNLLMLTDDGQIIDTNEQKWLQLPGEGWNCVTKIGEQQLIVGSFGGHIAYVYM